MNEMISEILEAYTRRGTGPLGVGFGDLVSGEECFVNGEKLFPLASVYKILTLCELARCMQEGSIRLEDKVILRAEDKRKGSGILYEAPEGSEYTVQEYIGLMMQISDNTAADYLTGLVGMEAIYRHVIQPLDLKDTRVDLSCRELLRRYYANPDERYPDPLTGKTVGDHRNNPYFACRAEQNNVSTPRDMVKLMKMLYKGKVVSPAADAFVLNEMALCQTNSRIPALLPEGTRAAHKTGTLDHLANDVGIVYSPAGAYILACFYNGNLASKEEYRGTSVSEKGTELIASLSRDIYQAYNA